MFSFISSIGRFLQLIFRYFFASSEPSKDQSILPAPVHPGVVESSIISTTQDHQDSFRVLDTVVHVVTTVEACRVFVHQIRIHCLNRPVIGLDCEWVQTHGVRQKVALLQLASPNGLCILVRLFKMESIPHELKELLADKDILKVGIDVFYDGEKLFNDYGIKMMGALDLRFLASKLQIRSRYSLAGLAETVVGIELNKDWQVSASNWESKQLSSLQIIYAAKDAIAALYIFRHFKQYIPWRDLNQYRDIPFNSSHQALYYSIS